MKILSPKWKKVFGAQIKIHILGPVTRSQHFQNRIKSNSFVSVMHGQRNFPTVIMKLFYLLEKHCSEVAQVEKNFILAMYCCAQLFSSTLTPKFIVNLLTVLSC